MCTSTGVDSPQSPVFAPAVEGTMHPPRRFASALLPALLAVATASVGTAAPLGWLRPLAARNLVLGFGPEQLASDVLRPTERSFLDKAADLTRDELRLARLAASQATSSEVRGFAQQLAGNQSQLNDSIEALRRAKAGTTEAAVAAGESPSKMYQQLAEKSGADFDRAFVQQVAATHGDILALFEQVLTDAKDAEVRDLAGGALPALRGDRNQLTALKKTVD
jgi:putative membrane protein